MTSEREDTIVRTSATHPIRLDAILVRKGLLGLTFCPGKHVDSLNGDRGRGFIS